MSANSFARFLKPQRKECIIGVCQTIGEDIGLNPDILRVALVLVMVVFPEQVALTYAIGAAVVLSAKLIFRDRRPKAAPAVDLTVVAPVAQAEAEQPRELLAA